MSAGTEGQAAATWWASALAAPVMDNGDELQSALGSMMALRHPLPTPSELEVFATALAQTIDNRIANGARFFAIGVDYGPDPELHDAAVVAAGDRVRWTWPWKTIMHIQPGKYVTVSAGYGAEHVRIWSPT
jgi:hypothetical protein